MSSTGEVACYGKTLSEAYLKSLIASRSGIKLKENQIILKLDDTDTTILEQKGHHVINDIHNIDWSNIDMVIDCSNSIKTKILRRKAIDFTIYLVTNKQQLNLISISLGTHLSIQPYLFYKNSLYKKKIKNL